jgi:tRNA:m4X modification enzyme
VALQNHKRRCIHRFYFSHWTGLDFIERQNLGFKCKRILDLGRLDALQKSGANEAKLVYYVEKDSSLENLCLQATWK